MKRLQFMAIAMLFFSFFVEIKASEEISKCNVVPNINTSVEDGEISFRIMKDNREQNVLNDIDLAIKVACHMQQNGECYYSSECQ
jgi:hypothetical protein